MGDKSINSVAKELIQIAGAKTVEQSYPNPRGCISFSDKVELMEKHFFLRSYTSLLDLDKSIEIQKRVLLMGAKEYQAEANEWMKLNSKAIDSHQKLRKGLRSAELIDSVFGDNIPFEDSDTIEIFRKCRNDAMSDSVKPGFLGLGMGKKKREYESETETAIEYLNEMQNSYKQFLASLDNEFSSMDRNEFFLKNSFSKYLKN